jgi:hypothetical protein
LRHLLTVWVLTREVVADGVTTMVVLGATILR